MKNEKRKGYNPPLVKRYSSVLLGGRVIPGVGQLRDGIASFFVAGLGQLIDGRFKDAAKYFVTELGLGIVIRAITSNEAKMMKGSVGVMAAKAIIVLASAIGLIVNKVCAIKDAVKGGIEPDKADKIDR